MTLNREELLTAVEENPEGIWKLYLSHMPDAYYRRTDEMRVMISRVPTSFFNGIAVTRLPRNGDGSVLRAAISEMEEAGVPWSYQVGPNCTPDDLEIQPDELGLRFSHDPPSIARTLA